jgi:hypothetical protein
MQDLVDIGVAEERRAKFTRRCIEPVSTNNGLA